MNTFLWKQISNFEFDDPLSEYGFITRLAAENYWTKDFSVKAIAEYKKFMYLAATSDMMVSPSEIIDVVWHQHLIFTQSYSDFCTLIGKNIQHVPSTHAREEFEKFRQARERTRKLYKEHFGEPPAAFWDYDTMYDTLQLPKAKYKIRTVIIAALLLLAMLLFPCYKLMKPVYAEIDNPEFLLVYLFLILLSGVVLEAYNRSYLNSAIKKSDPSSFIFSLLPSELIYLKFQSLVDVIHGYINEFIKKDTLRINSDYSLQLQYDIQPKTPEEFVVYETLRAHGTSHYPVILKTLINKPVFSNIAYNINAFKKFFIKSMAFGKLFYINLATGCVLILLGLTRIFTGIMRDKPVLLIAFAVIAVVIVSAFYLWRLTRLVCTITIPQLYRNESALVPEKDRDTWDWQYFLFGSSVFAASFVPIADYIEKYQRSSSGNSGCGTSCGSSCGSSCSSCGGCGGGD